MALKVNRLPLRGRFGVDRLFNFSESGDTWHTKYNVNSIPLDLIIDLKTVNQLDKFHYLPRADAGNGTLLKGTVSYSMDKENWMDSLIWLTPAGVNLAEGDITDVGVIIDE